MLIATVASDTRDNRARQLTLDVTSEDHPDRPVTLRRNGRAIAVSAVRFVFDGDSLTEVHFVTADGDFPLEERDGRTPDTAWVAWLGVLVHEHHQPTTV
ncbi:hypothetical protein [Streptomyces sp. NPDC058745]|uniref:hypothetical protein n=1 Tax=Streptomyces sp. NPDC058745 TaxID=3346621 RepID=UPI0036C0B194